MTAPERFADSQIPLAPRAPSIHARVIELGYELFPRERQTPEVLGTLVKADAEKWWPVIRELGIRSE
jgi:hypothetical protein